MSSPPPAPARAPRPQLPAPGVALALFTESVAHRTELAALELEEARDHACGSLLLAVAATAMVFFTGFAITLLLASLVWEDPHRGWWLGGLCVVYLASTLAAGFMLRRRLRAWRPLGETQLQLQQDYQCLSHLLKSAAP